ncbi:acetylcholine receptor subunit delta-like [Convolutriloba macropyga]|uniref:acetylcholine receptor subunit delta-like n=1 Tax=Convolutriloba macropyga TaxID=536237 RepID=UPI003F5252E6
MRVFCLVFLANQFRTALSWNLDSEVTSFVTTYLPAKHKPVLLRDLVFTFADLYNIIEVNEKEETITTKLWMYVGYAVEVGATAWNDSGLVDVLEIFPGFDKVWLPDVIVLNRQA